MADITITYKSSRSSIASFRNASAKSAWIERSWNSSIITTLIPSKDGSDWSLRVSMASVMISSRGSFEIFDSRCIL